MGDKVPSTKNAITLAIMMAPEYVLKPGIMTPGISIMLAPINNPVALFSIDFRTVFREENTGESKCFPILTDTRMTPE